MQQQLERCGKHGCLKLPASMLTTRRPVLQSDVKRDLITATAGVSLVASFLMGVGANLPVAAAPGMGLNAYFACALFCSAEVS